MRAPTVPAVVTLDDVRAARERVADVAIRTPVLGSRTFSDLAGATVLLKAEHLQKTGSFKIRGATNRLAALTDEERRRGVIAMSAGNHAQGVAYHAQRLEANERDEDDRGDGSCGAHPENLVAATA